MRYLLLVLILTCAAFAPASQESIGPIGIRSSGLVGNDGQPLTGNAMLIGQIEVVRPGKPGFDDPTQESTYIVPTGVFHIDQPATENVDVGTDAGGQHAEIVAGVMISTHPALTGVATQADLYSSAITTTTSSDNVILSLQKIATQTVMLANGTQITPRAINHSWGNTIVPEDSLDGNSQITLGLDWAASRYDVLNVVAGNEEDFGESVPTDQFNGITVAASQISTQDSKFDRASFFNVFNSDPTQHSTVDLMAPGQDIEVQGRGTFTDTESGTSLAAPHVTATVALLQQYAGQKFPGNADTGHHQVMKAVLMNSADKLIDNNTIMGPNGLVPQGGLLGMDRTALNQAGVNWLGSPANDDDVNNGTTLGTVALDPQMGTGELDAKRALQQFSAGEFHSFENNGPTHVPAIGWDYGHSSHTGQDNNYALNQQLVANSYISVTIAFDRVVQFDQDNETQNHFDAGDTFLPSTDVQVPGHDQFSDLDLYLIKSDTGEVVANSICSVDTVDHIFFQIPEAGMYTIDVNQFNDHGGPVDYGLAWWADGNGKILSDLGDINQDGHIDAADIQALMSALSDLHKYETDHSLAGQDLLDIADINGDGVVDNTDIQAEISLIANTESGFGEISAVPEPASICLLAFGAVALLCFGRNKACNNQRFHTRLDGMTDAGWQLPNQRRTIRFNRRA